MSMALQTILYAYLPLLAKGLLTTARLWALSALVSTAIGSILGILCGSRTALSSYLTPLIDCYVFVWRGVPVYVQLLIAYFVLPDLLGINLSPESACVLALSLCSAAYITNIVRSGIAAVNQGQWEAAQAIGLSTTQTMRFIIVPQATKIVAPVLINEYESLIKSTALFSAIGVPEITKVGRTIIAQHLNPVPIYGIIVILYLILSALLASVAWFVRKKLNARKAPLEIEVS